MKITHWRLTAFRFHVWALFVFPFPCARSRERGMVSRERLKKRLAILVPWISVSWGNPICFVIDAVYGKRNDTTDRPTNACRSFSHFEPERGNEKTKTEWRRTNERKKSTRSQKLSSKKLVLLYSVLGCFLLPLLLLGIQYFVVFLSLWLWFGVMLSSSLAGGPGGSARSIDAWARYLMHIGDNSSTSKNTFNFVLSEAECFYSLPSSVVSPVDGLGVFFVSLPSGRRATRWGNQMTLRSSILRRWSRSKWAIAFFILAEKTIKPISSRNSAEMLSSGANIKWINLIRFYLESGRSKSPRKLTRNERKEVRERTSAG